MKKILIAAFFSAVVFNVADAQTAVTATAVMTKAEKEAAKAKKEADLVDAFTKAGLSADEQKKCRAALEESNEKAKPIKGDVSLTEDDKKAKLDAIYKERNDMLKEIMGDAKFKSFKAAQKAQKEAAATNAGQ